MLCDVNVSPDKAERLYPGVYQSWCWNFELDFRGHQDFHKDYPELGDDFYCGGVCDSPEQLLTLLPKAVTEGPTKYVVSMVRLDKANEEGRNWRWHKWGAYIGAQEPQCEYLFDEPVIETVWTFHVYEV